MSVNIPLYIQYGQIGQFSLANKYANDLIFKGVSFAPDYIPLLFTIEETVEDQYNVAGSTPALEWLANYMVALSGIWPINTTPPVTTFIIVIQPQSQTINSGSNVTFSVVVAGGTTPYTYQWSYNGSPIGGATNSTYTITGATSGNAGNYTVQIKDANNQILNSNTAILTVNVPQLTADWWWGDTDPWPDLSTGTDNLTYLGTVNFNPGGPIVIPWPSASANNKYRVVRYPVAEGNIVSWVNIVGFNYGPIPGTAYNPIATITTKKYVVSKGDSVQSPYSVTYSE